MNKSFNQEDKKFIESVRNGSFPAADFRHDQHLRLTWMHCLKQQPVQAIDQVCADIAAFTRMHGAEKKFNLTLTVFLTVVVFLRLKAQENHVDFEAWLDKNIDLKYHAIEQTAKFYSLNIIKSDEAKKKFVWPDLEEMPAAMQNILDEYFTAGKVFNDNRA